MSGGYGPRSWLDRLVGACFGLLLAAIALHWAVRLIESVWPALVAVAVVVGVVVTAVSAWRARSRGW